MDFVYKNVLIFGYGRSGKEVEKVLKDIKINYKIYDDKIKINGGCFIYKLSYKKLRQFDLIVLSPGVSISNKYIKKAELLNIKIISELEFGFWFTSADIIAVTGTNGKTSTTLAITNLLKNEGYKCDAYGNIGKPLTSAYKKNYDFIICEVSSFQLEASDRFLPKTTVILNIAPDHIDRHGTFRSYINCKKEILKNCKKDSIIFANGDNEHCRDMLKDVVADITLFSKKDEKSGIYLKENKVYVNGENGKELFLDLKNNKVQYSDNLLALVGVAKWLNISGNKVLDVVKNSKAPHRYEVFLKHKNVTYINDSKGTNIHACQKAIDTTSGNIILMLGGYNKRLRFNTFFKELTPKVKHVILFGECKRKLYAQAKKQGVNCYVSKTFEDACDNAIENVSSGDSVLFSPACASFDEFNNYAERGDYFKSLILSKVNKNEKV